MVSQYLTDLGLTAVEFAFTDTNDISAVTQAACDECDVLYIPTDNTAANCAETINNVALNSKTPIICGEENLCKGCGVATLSISYYDLGYQTGLMAYKVLVEGQDIKTLQVEYAPETKHEFNQVLAEVYGLTFGSDYEALNMDE